MAAYRVSGVALITGAASGIGRETAFSFAESGAIAICLADRNKHGIDEVAEECRKYSTSSEFKVLSIMVDVTDVDSVQTMVDAAIAEFGRINYFVHSAGIGVNSFTPVPDTEISEFDNLVDVNMKGTFLCNRAVSKAMMSQEMCTFTGHNRTRDIGRGCIVNIGSGNSIVALPGKLSYTAAKHGAMAVTKTTALDVGRNGIRVNAVCPSWTDTPMVANEHITNPQLAATIKAIVPCGRMAETDEVSDTIVFLCSPAASYISGAALFIDNGLSLSIRLA